MFEHAAQLPFRIRFGWGREDVLGLAPTVDALVIIDVLRFTSAVSVAVNRGAIVFPYAWADKSAADYAHSRNAVLAGDREDPAPSWSLSPTDLAAIPSGTRLVLPSPNGSALAALAADRSELVAAGCLRNARAVGMLFAGVVAVGGSVAVVAAGERWPDEGGAHSGPLRPAVEDLLGSGAIIARLMAECDTGARSISPEARAAAAAFRDAESDLETALRESVSGRELLARGWDDDVNASAQLDVDDRVPVLRDGCFC